MYDHRALQPSLAVNSSMGPSPAVAAAKEVDTNLGQAEPSPSQAAITAAQSQPTAEQHDGPVAAVPWIAVEQPGEHDQPSHSSAEVDTEAISGGERTGAGGSGFVSQR